MLNARSQSFSLPCYLYQISLMGGGYHSQKLVLGRLIPARSLDRFR